MERTRLEREIGKGCKVAIAVFDVAVARQTGYFKFCPFIFPEFEFKCIGISEHPLKTLSPRFHFFLQSHRKEFILDFSPRQWFFGADLFPL